MLELIQYRSPPLSDWRVDKYTVITRFKFLDTTRCGVEPWRTAVHVCAI